MKYVKLNQNAITFFSKIYMGPQVTGTLRGNITDIDNLKSLPGTDLKTTLAFLNPNSPYYGIVDLRSILSMFFLYFYHEINDCYYEVTPTPLMCELLGVSESPKIDLHKFCDDTANWGDSTEIQNIGDHNLIDFAFQNLDID